MNLLAFTPDGRTLAFGGTDNVVRLWDVTTGKEALPLGGHQSTVSAAALSPDGRLIATGGGDGVIRLWDPATGRERGQFPGHGTRTASLAFGGGGRLLISAGSERTGGADPTIRVWVVAPGKPLRHFPGAIAVLSPDGNLLVTADEREMRLLEAASGREIRRWPVPRGGIMPLAVCPPVNEIISWGADGKLRVWDAATGKEQRQFSGPHFPEDSRDRVYCLGTSPDGRLAAFGGQAQEVALLDTHTGAEVWRLTGVSRAISALAFSADSRVVAAADGTTGTVRLWEVATGRPFRTLAGHQGDVRHMTFSLDGLVLLTAGDDTTALLWDVTGRRTQGASLPPSGPGLEALWNDLEAEDARRGQEAVGILVAAPRQALALLARRLRPAAPPDGERLARLIGDLDNDDFEVRERAVAGLREEGEAAEPALRRAFATSPSPEVRERVKPLLTKLDRSAEWFPTLRALQVMESVGTPEARQLLESLARGAGEARLTREAKASLERLSRRTLARP
jgi:WD40 repeat protein